MEGVYLLLQRRLRQKREALQKIRMAFRNMDKLPEPTIENTWHPNTHNLIQLRTWLFSRWPILRHFSVTQKLIKFGIIIHAFDQPWRWIMESVGEEAAKLEWTSWWHNVHNLIMLKGYFRHWCHLNRERMNLITRGFDAVIILYIFCPPFRKLIKEIWIKAQGMKWEGKTYEIALPPKYVWWREDNETQGT